MNINSKGEKLEWKDLKPKNIVSFLKDKWTKFWGIRIKHEDAIAWAEIMIYRTASCPECVDDGACLKSKGGCGCSFPNMAFDLSKICGKEKSGAPRWFPVDKSVRGGLSLTEYWNKFKIEHNFEIDIKRF